MKLGANLVDELYGPLMRLVIPDVQHFTDYRAFLTAHVRDMKRINPKWSFGSWANRLGLKDTSSITKILNGDREPGEQITAKIISYFSFKTKDAEYFQDLVRLSKIRNDPRLSVILLEKMAKKNPRSAGKLMDEKTFTAISSWFYLPLREMVRLPDFEEGADWFSAYSIFKVSASDLKKAIADMLELKLLGRDKAGRLFVSEGELRTTDDFASEAIKRYHEQMLVNARASVRAVDVLERELQAESLVMDSKNLEKAKYMIREFRAHFSRTFEDAGGDAVFQFQMQLFPLTKKNPSENK